jgi:hypothetical protein
MVMEEQQTPPKAARGGGLRKGEEDKRPRNQQNSAGKQASAALDSPLKLVFKSVSCMKKRFSRFLFPSYLP